MRTLPLLLFSILFYLQTGTGFAQEETTPPLRKGTFIIGTAAGTRCAVGNWGISTNLFATKWLSLKLAGGIGLANFNGATGSAGPEIFLPLAKQFYVCGSSVFTGTLGAYDVLGDDDTPDHHFFETGRGRYWRSSGGLVFSDKEGGMLFRLEAGYSHALKTPSYNLLGPAPWTTSQIQKVERGLGSGLLVSLSVDLIIRPDDWKQLFRKH